MIKRAAGYDPATIYRAKREQKRAIADLGGSAKSDRTSQVQVDPSDGKLADETDYGVFTEAVKFFNAVKEPVKKLNEKIDELEKLTKASLNTSLNDQDRKQINKKFVSTRAEIDSIAKETEFNGVKVLGGESKGESVSLKVGDEESDRMEVRIDRMDNEASGLDGLKVDTLVNARKASKELEGIKRLFQTTALMLKTKEDNMLNRRDTYLARNAADSSPDGGPGRKAVDDRELREKMRSSLFSDLKAKQEYLSHLEGRETALLINKRW